MCIPINLIGVLYIIFVLKEVKREKPETDADGIDNAGFETTTDGVTRLNDTQNSNGHNNLTTETEAKEPTNFFVDFFNPVVAVQCLEVLTRKRENNGRIVVIFLFIMYFVAIGPAFGEEPNEYNFTRIQLNWDGILYSAFATYGNALSLVGTIIMVTVLSKLLKCSDPFLGIVGTCLSCVSRVLYVRSIGFDDFIRVPKLII